MIEKMPEDQRENILCINKNREYLLHLDKILTSNGYSVFLTDGLGKALEYLAKNSPSVILTEIFFDDIEPIEFLRAIRKQSMEPVVIILTKKTERRTGSNRRLGNIFEYLNINITEVELVSHIKQAVLFYKEKSNMLSFMNQAEKRMTNQLEWLLWKENFKLTDKVEFGKTLIANMKNSILQGMGIGSMLTKLEMLELIAEPTEDNKIKIPSGFLTSILETTKSVHIWLENLDNLRIAFDRKFIKETIPIAQVYQAIQKAIDSVVIFQKIKQHEVFLGTFNFNLDVYANFDLIVEVVQELLVNAFKYSPGNTKIHVSVYRTGNSVSISILNDVLTMRGAVTGIPEDFESQIFEPFFKLNNTYDERYHDEKWSMGTGLTICQHYIHQIGGKIYLYEVFDHATGDKPRKRIVGELILQIVQDDLHPQND